MADLLAALEGERHDRFASRLAELTAGVSGGKFSLAWQYPDLVDFGATLYQEQRAEGLETERQRRQLDDAKVRAAGRLRGTGEGLVPEMVSKLGASLRSARDLETVAAVEREYQRAGDSVRSQADRRRQREIDRTRDRMAKALPRRPSDSEPAESWQEVLRRFAAEGLGNRGEAT